MNFCWLLVGWVMSPEGSTSWRGVAPDSSWDPQAHLEIAAPFDSMLSVFAGINGHKANAVGLVAAADDDDPECRTG